MGTSTLFRRAGWQRYLLLAVVLAIATAGLMRSEMRFEPEGSNVLPRPWTEAGIRPWRLRGQGELTHGPSGTTVTLTPGDRSAVLGQPIPRHRAFDYVRLRAELRSTDLPSSELWHGGWLGLVSIGDRGRRLAHWPEHVAHFTGSTGWTPVSGVLPVARHARSVHFVVTAVGDRGKLEVRGLEVEQVRERRIARLGRFALMAGWLALWVLVLRHAVAGRSWSKALAVLSANLVLVAGLAPQPAMNDTLAAIADRLGETAKAGVERWEVLTSANRPRPTPPTVGAGHAAADRRGSALESAPPNRSTARGSPDRAQSEPSRARETVGLRHEVHRKPSAQGTASLGARLQAATHTFMEAYGDKAAHFAAFTVLSLLTGLAYRHTAWPARAAALTALAVSIQALQLFTHTREGDLPDLLGDLSGIFAGIGLAGIGTRLWSRLRTRHRRAFAAQ